MGKLNVFTISLPIIRIAISATARLKRKKLVDVLMERFLKQGIKGNFKMIIIGLIQPRYPVTVQVCMRKLLPVMLMFQLRFNRKKV